MHYYTLFKFTQSYESLEAILDNKQVVFFDMVLTFRY
jgi:hypothetical protein